MRHLHFPSSPVNVWAVFLQPGVAHNDLLIAQASHCEEGTFRVVLVPQDQLHYFRDRISLIQGAIYILNRDTTGEGPGRESVCLHIGKSHCSV